MKQDKAIIKALQSKENSTLSSDFNTLTMNKIIAISATQKKRKFVLTYSLISIISVSLISFGIFVLKDYLSFNSVRSYFTIFSNPESKTIFGFFTYIALLVLLLIFFDGYFRHLREKKLNNIK